LQYCLISSKDIFSLEIKFFFVLLSIKKVVNKNLIFELNSNYKKLSKILFYAIEYLEINIANKQTSKNIKRYNEQHSKLSIL